MKKTQLALAIGLMVSGSVYATGFTNGGFEDGNLNGWTQGGGNWSANGDVNPPIYVAYTGATLPTAPQYNGGTANNTIMTGGIDPITGANRVYSDKNSVRVNDSTNNWSVSTISQSVLGYADNNIFFAWNAVLEASHGLPDSDYFSLTLRDDTTNTDLVSRAYSSAGSIGAGTTGVTWTAFGNWFSSGWVTEQVDLVAANAVGHNFTLSLLASDCPYGGHAGYVYLDGFGATIPIEGSVPEPEILAMLAFGALGLATVRRRRLFKAA